ASVPRSLAAVTFVGLDEDVDLVVPLVALLIGDGERRRVLADLLVGVRGILLGALLAVAEIPGVGPRTAFFLFHGRRELHLQRRRPLVRLGFRDHVELVLVLVLVRRGRSRRRRALLSGGGRGGGGLRSLTAAPARDQHEWRHREAGGPDDQSNFPVSHGRRSY